MGLKMRMILELLSFTSALTLLYCAISQSTVFLDIWSTCCLLDFDDIAVLFISSSSLIANPSPTILLAPE